MAEQPAGAGETRVCMSCMQSFPFTVEFWPIKYGKPKQGRCRTCVRAEKKIFDRNTRQKRVAARTQSGTTLSEPTAPPASGAVVSTDRDRLPGELPLRQLEIVKALREGAKFLNEQARSVLDTLFYYAADPGHPHHEWAIKLIADRILPRKLYEDLGAAAAGLAKPGEGGGNRPSVTIIVQPSAGPGAADASPAQPLVAVLDGEAKRVE